MQPWKMHYWKKLFNKEKSKRQRYLAFTCLGLAFLIVLLILYYQLANKTVKFEPLPDFSSISDTREMKAAFFNYLEPIVAHHNERVTKERNQLLTLQEQYAHSHKLRRKDLAYISKMAQKYNYIPFEGWDQDQSSATDSSVLADVIQALLLRVDEIPASLALVQAAKESGWGRSRFAVEANNLFGQWCYTKGCGLVPVERTKGAQHEVAKFATASAAISSYINNLNSHKSYEKLWLIRKDLRTAGKPITGKALAGGLIYYSQRRQAYVNDIKAMLNDYQKLQQQPKEKAITQAYQ